ncbi:Uncharacterized protein dnm_091220 [Desulfonema magnum]|uniref:Uncharacterized protein n=1 Tax=Desulfonema magnum TaxID=45655 RepID=A0A975GTI9_9BACT|nr:Uncharacterized protein dnm_091220 [Desulfonema magnum]
MKIENSFCSHASAHLVPMPLSDGVFNPVRQNVMLLKVVQGKGIRKGRCVFLFLSPFPVLSAGLSTKSVRIRKKECHATSSNYSPILTSTSAD